MNEQEYEWIAISEMAKREGVTAQTIRNRIAQGMYETQTFQRGTMIGILIKTPKQQ